MYQKGVAIKKQINAANRRNHGQGDRPAMWSELEPIIDLIDQANATKITQGGDSFGANVVIGTKDSYRTVLIAGNSEALVLDKVAAKAAFRLNIANASDEVIIKISTRELVNSTGNTVVNWETRRLYDANGIVFDWSARTLGNTSIVQDAAIVKLGNANVQNVGVYIYNATPEAALTAGRGSLAIDHATGTHYYKTTNTGNTGWRTSIMANLAGLATNDFLKWDGTDWIGATVTIPTQYWTDGTTYLTPYASRNIIAGVSSNISIGYNTIPSGVRLSVMGSGNDATQYALKIENSSNLVSLQVRNDGSVYNYGAGGVATNTAYGESSLTSNTSGAENSSYGKSALSNNTTGSYNVAVGKGSLAATTTGGYNTAVGTDTFLYNTTGSYNVAIGFQAGYLNGSTGTSGSYNIYIGYSAGYSEVQTTGAIIIHPGNDNGYFSDGGNIKIGAGTWTTAIHDIHNNIAIGNQASRLNHGNDNVAIGGGAAAYDSTGFQYVSIGSASGGAGNWGTPHAASKFVAIGYNALGSSTGDFNTAVGHNAGSSNTTGTHNVFIGDGANASAGNLTNATAIGYGATVGASNTLVLGSGQQVVIGATTAETSAAFEVKSTTGAVLLPRMTTTQRDALTAVNGMIIYNSTLDKFQGYENGGWANLI